MTAIYTFQRGESMIYGTRVVSGDPAGVTVIAKLKPLAAGSMSPPANDAPIAATFSVSFVAAAGNMAAQWLFSLTPAQTLALPAGKFIADEKYSFADGSSIITDPVIIDLRNSVSG